MKHCICMISDFFYPNMGGLENHMYQLSQHLIALGHKVIIVTHLYGDRKNVRYLSNYLKVYYLPILPIYREATIPLLFPTLPLLRDIFVRECVTIVHGHGAFSTLCMEGILHAGMMGLKTVFTDHSLFGFADGSSIFTNKFLGFITANLDHAICVSYTSKENTVLRSSLQPTMVSVIPNAVDATCFTPDPTRRRPGRITVVVVSRLVYRKGMDLLAGLIPIICLRYRNVDFIIGGDGPKRVLLEEVREKHCLQERVTMLGGLHHSQVRDVLVQGDIFINPSITEAFCIAIVEAACCGLQVVATKVGGVPEVLPQHLVHLAETSVAGLVEATEAAIRAHKMGKAPSPEEVHQEMKNVYTWEDIAFRTNKVYDQIIRTPQKNITERLKNFYQCGPLAGKLYLVVATLLLFTYWILQWWRPEQHIDRAPTMHKSDQQDASTDNTPVATPTQ